MKIRPAGAELFHVDGHDETVATFRSFVTAPKMTLCSTFCAVSWMIS
jgi:hypothetical protein